MLNYAYAALEGELRIKAIAEGYDPTIGVKQGSNGSSKLIFDIMSQSSRSGSRGAHFRKSTVFDAADFVIRNDGVCGLNPELARMVAGRVSKGSV
jgi:CRISPR-associated protein Cas1